MHKSSKLQFDFEMNRVSCFKYEWSSLHFSSILQVYDCTVYMYIVMCVLQLGKILGTLAHTNTSNCISRHYSTYLNPSNSYMYHEQTISCQIFHWCYFVEGFMTRKKNHHMYFVTVSYKLLFSPQSNK